MAAGGFLDTIGSAFKGLFGATTDILNSEGVGKLADAGSAYIQAELNQKAMDKASELEAARLLALENKQAAMPSWVAPVGIGLAGLLTVGLLFSMFSRRK